MTTVPVSREASLSDEGEAYTSAQSPHSFSDGSNVHYQRQLSQQERSISSQSPMQLGSTPDYSNSVPDMMPLMFPSNDPFVYPIQPISTLENNDDIQLRFPYIPNNSITTTGENTASIAVYDLFPGTQLSLSDLEALNDAPTGPLNPQHLPQGSGPMPHFEIGVSEQAFWDSVGIQQFPQSHPHPHPHPQPQQPPTQYLPHGQVPINNLQFGVNAGLRAPNLGSSGTGMGMPSNIHRVHVGDGAVNNMGAPSRPNADYGEWSDMGHQAPMNVTRPPRDF